jgi:putative SOS response-associated peptidase YedK
MCGRFGQYNITAELLRKTFRIDHAPNELVSSYNIAPTDEVLTVGDNPETGERNAEYLRWGLIPFWVDDPAEFDLDLINARMETAPEKNSFKKPFHSQRCIIPASGFYEWKPTDNGKHPYWIHPTEDELFGFAGLWDSWTDDNRVETIQSFTILTRDANDMLEKLHDRMPVIIDPENYDEWLDPERSGTDELQGFLDEYPSDQVDFHPVTKAINNPTYDEEDCVEPTETT